MKYRTLVTNKGIQKLSNAIADGKKLTLATVSVGDGNGEVTEPKVDQAALVNEVWSGAISSATFTDNQLKVTIIIPAKDGGFTERELGVYDEDGDLFAVANLPDFYKPTPEEGSSSDQTIVVVIALSNVNDVTVNIDPSVSTATQQFVTDQLAGYVKQTLKINNYELSKDINLSPTDVNAIQATLVGSIGNDNQMADANKTGWWSVAVTDTSKFKDWPTDASGVSLYGYGYLFVHIRDGVWLQHYYSHRGTNAKRQNWNAGPTTDVAWVYDYNNASNIPYVKDIGDAGKPGGTAWGNSFVGFSSGDGDMPNQGNDFGVITVVNRNNKGSGAYQLFFDGDSSGAVTNFHIYARGLDGDGLLNTAKAAELYHTGKKPSAADVGAVPTSRKVNGLALSGDISLNSGHVGAVPTSRKINGKTLTADITLGSGDVGAVPTSRKVNGHALTGDVTITAANMVSSSGVGAVGTYALCCCTDGVWHGAGTSVAGSKLRYSSAGEETSGTPGGTWRLMGVVKDGGGYDGDEVSLFYRIS